MARPSSAMQRAAAQEELESASTPSRPGSAARRPSSAIRRRIEQANAYLKEGAEGGGARGVAAASPNVKLTSLKGVAPKMQGVLGAKYDQLTTPSKKDALLDTPSSGKNAFSVHRAIGERGEDDVGDYADEEDISRRLPFTNSGDAPKTPAKGAWGTPTTEDGAKAGIKPAMSPVFESPIISLVPPEGQGETPVAGGAFAHKDAAAQKLVGGGCENADGNVFDRQTLAPPSVVDSPVAVPATAGMSHGGGEGEGEGQRAVPSGTESVGVSSGKKAALTRGSNFEEQKRLARERGRARALVGKQGIGGSPSAGGSWAGAAGGGGSTKSAYLAQVVKRPGKETAKEAAADKDKKTNTSREPSTERPTADTAAAPAANQQLAASRGTSSTPSSPPPTQGLAETTPQPKGALSASEETPATPADASTMSATPGTAGSEGGGEARRSRCRERRLSLNKNVWPGNEGGRRRWSDRPP